MRLVSLFRHIDSLTGEALHGKHQGRHAAKRRLLLGDLELLALRATEAVLHGSVLLGFLSALTGAVVAGRRHGGRGAGGWVRRAVPAVPRVLRVLQRQIGRVDCQLAGGTAPARKMLVLPPRCPQPPKAGLPQATSATFTSCGCKQDCLRRSQSYAWGAQEQRGSMAEGVDTSQYPAGDRPCRHT